VAPEDELDASPEESVDALGGPSPEDEEGSDPSPEETVDGTLLPDASPGASGAPDVVVDGPLAPTASPAATPDPSAYGTTPAPPSASGPSSCPVASVQSVDLLPTRNFERVNLQIQMAGYSVKDRCGFTPALMALFIELSAQNTDSLAELWYVTDIRDGPPVDVPNLQVVLVTPAPSAVPDAQNASAATVVADSSSSYAPVSAPLPVEGSRFSGSVIFNVTAFLDPLSTELVFGSYVGYIKSQQIVLSLNAGGSPGVQWVGLLRPPALIDDPNRPDRDLPPVELDAAGGSGAVPGIVAGVIVGVALVVGLAGVVVLESIGS
jgi:hypothetical protein